MMSKMSTFEIRQNVTLEIRAKDVMLGLTFNFDGSSLSSHSYHLSLIGVLALGQMVTSIKAAIEDCWFLW